MLRHLLGDDYVDVQYDEGDFVNFEYSLEANSPYLDIECEEFTEFLMNQARERIKEFAKNQGHDEDIIEIILNNDDAVQEQFTPLQEIWQGYIDYLCEISI